MASFLCYLMSTRFLFILPLFHAIATNCFSSMQPLCHDDESSALLQFKESFDTNVKACNGPFDYPKTAPRRLKGVDKDCCSWDGVECDENTGHVIGLNLTRSCLYGSMPSNSSLFCLVHLQRLNLAYNHFSFSEIPSGFSRLSSLIYFNLSNSSFPAQIPSKFSELSKLTSLDLSNNYMLHLRSIKVLVQNSTSLKDLRLSYVQISSLMPEILANLSGLTTLHLSGFGLFGELPVEIFNLPKLQDLRVSYNQDLIGKLPKFYSSNPLKFLSLQGTSFSTKLPASIGNLNSLNELWLGSCNFLGRISPSIGNLTQLTTLDLSNNSFMGQIPSSLLNLISLNYLDFSYCQLSGSIPSSFGNLRQLTVLLSNYFLKISNPSSLSWLSKLSKLTVLAFKGINLTMEIPSSLANLTQLNYLNLYSNNLTDTVSLHMFMKLKYLTSFFLSLNDISFLPEPITNATLNRFVAIGLGSCKLSNFPDFLRNQDHLQVLDLSHNNIHGQIPNGCFDHHLFNFPWPRLKILDLRSNKLHALPPVPPPSTLVYLVADNKLQGEISPLICNLSSLYFFDLSNDKFGGMLPPCFSKFRNSLTILNLRGNTFDGIIPQLCGEGSTMKMIDLSQNQFEGVLPRLLSNCRMLEFLNIGSNNLNDVFPSWLGTLPKLRVLILRHNGIYGVVGSPTTIFFKPCRHDSDDVYPYTMTIINKGRETVYLKIIKVFAAIDLSRNEFNGMIPEFIGNLNGFQLLNLSNNNLTGPIPLSLGNLTAMECLDLSQNKLSGQISWQLTHLTFLASFNVSHNQLPGPIPHGNQFDTFDNSSFDGNLGLCGNPLSKRCENPKPSPLPTSSIEEDQDSWFNFEFDWKTILMGYGSGLVIGVVVGNILNKFFVLTISSHFYLQLRNEYNSKFITTYL
ncbi:hypothetical protein ACB094_03G033400 [Castanea mollissima]